MVQAMARELRRSASAEFTELIQSGRSAVQRARRNVHIFDINPNLRRPHITGGYRINHSIGDCLQSLFQLHNETFNVWSHLIGCVIFLALLYHVKETPCEAEHCPERWPLYVFVASALWCLSASAAYHLVGTANEKWTVGLEKSDYIGIVALIVGSCAPVVYYGFGPAYASTRLSYMLAIAAIGVGVVVCSFSPWFNKRPLIPVFMFISLALCGVVALLHATIAHDFSPRTVALLTGVVQMGACYLTGVALYVSHFPEALVPRQFSAITDIWGSSHQLWHVCVLAAAMHHFFTVLNLWHETAKLSDGMNAIVAAASVAA
jgi:adiponectin receptor